MKIKTKKWFIKRKAKFQHYKNCLKAAQLERKIDINSLKEYKREFVKSNKLITKTQQRFKSERHNVLLKKLTRLL